MIEAIIFDMDGLMINSEPIHYRAFAQALGTVGKTYTEKENAIYLGMSDKDESEDMLTKFRLPITPEELVRRKKEAYRDLLKEVTPQPGLLELLDYLQKEGYKKAVASSSVSNEIETIIKSLKVETFFDGYYSADQVRNGKPAPDLFLFAAKGIGVSPTRCLVLEDAPRGIEAAERAGMQSYAIPSNETRGMDFQRATRVMKSLFDVPKFLQLDRFREFTLPPLSQS